MQWFLIYSSKVKGKSRKIKNYFDLSLPLKILIKSENTFQKILNAQLIIHRIN